MNDSKIISLRGFSRATEIRRQGFEPVSSTYTICMHPDFSLQGRFAPGTAHYTSEDEDHTALYLHPKGLLMIVRTFAGDTLDSAEIVSQRPIFSRADFNPPAVSVISSVLIKSGGEPIESSRIGNQLHSDNFFEFDEWLEKYIENNEFKSPMAPDYYFVTSPLISLFELNTVKPESVEKLHQERLDLVGTDLKEFLIGNPRKAITHYPAPDAQSGPT